MTDKKRWKTAQELMDDLANDPEYVRRRAEKDEKFRRLRDRLTLIERPILDKLVAAGFPANSIEDATKRYAPLPEPIVSMFLEYVTTCEDERITDALVRALGAAKSSFDGRSLIDRYIATSNEGLRFAILNTIALAHPHSIDDWLQKARANPHLRQRLADLGHKW